MSFSKRFPLEVSWLLGIAVVFLVLVLGCHPPSDEVHQKEHFTVPSPGVPSDTSFMAGQLAVQLGRQTRDPSSYDSRILAEHLALQVRQTQDPYERLSLHLEWAEELLSSNQAEEAAREFKAFFQDVQRLDPDYYRENQAYLLLRQAVAKLRVSEIQNCLAHHQPESCIFPFSKPAEQQLGDGAREAIPLLRQALEVEPDNPSARWLLNVCTMATGGDLLQLDPSMRLPLERLGLVKDFPRFLDTAARKGLAVEGLSGGVVLEDLDGDQDLDVLFSSWSLEDQVKLLLNRGDGTFEDVTSRSGLNGITGGLNMVHADYDNDGDVDVFILRGAWFADKGKIPNSLLRNEGGGRFSDVTRPAGVLSKWPTQAAVWWDYDSDGLLDLFVANESTQGFQVPCELYRNLGNGKFEETAAKVGLDCRGFFKAAVACDHDLDGDPDLFLADLDGKDLFFENLGPDTEGNWTFRERGEDWGMDSRLHSFPSWFWDYDQDGWPDLFTADFDFEHIDDVPRDFLGLRKSGETLRLYRNLEGKGFRDVTESSGLKHPTLAMGANFADVDHNGYPDFYIGNGTPDFADIYPNRFFQNMGNGTFREVTAASGMGHLQKGHGVAFGDVDGDGDLDVVQVVGGAYSGDRFFNACFENPGFPGNWVEITLEGVQCNRSAIGSRVRILTGQASKKESYHWVGTGGSFGSQPLRVHAGLGDATVIDSVEVLWAGQTEPETFEGLSPGRRYQLRQGGGVREVTSGVALLK